MRGSNMKIFGKRIGKEKPRTAVVGAWGEGVAAVFLEQNGYRIIGRNVRPDRRDEIDIIARIGASLVFVEVKTRAY
jgi:putative endonuclease